MRIIFFLFFLFGKNGMGMFGQTILVGKITDKNSGEEMIGANVVLKKDGVFAYGITTDVNGNYVFLIDSGTYDVEVSYTGYPTENEEGVIVKEGEKKEIDIYLDFDKSHIIWCPIWTGYRIPLIEMDKPTYQRTTDSYQIKNSPTRNIQEISSFTPGVSFGQ